MSLRVRYVGSGGLRIDISTMYLYFTICSLSQNFVTNVTFYFSCVILTLEVHLMPFYEQPKTHKIEIDYEKYQTIAVFTYTDSEGSSTPLKIKIDLPDESRVTVPVDSVRLTKELHGRTLYNCYVTLNGRKQLIDIIYYKEQGLWVTSKINSY